jgi:UDP:flavonoid glycosyltransferase YjiC (YdhE family)
MAMRDPDPSRKIVLATLGTLGDLHPFIALGSRLRALGYDPVVATSAMHGPKVRSEGLGFCPMRPDMADLDRVLQLDRRRLAGPGWSGAEFLIRRVALPALRQGYDDVMQVMPGARAAVVSSLSYAARLAAETAGVPVVTVALQPAAFLSAYDPPVGFGLPFASAKAGAPAVAFNKLVRAVLLGAARGWAPRLDRFRAELGLSRSATNPLFDGHLRADLTLGLYSPLLGGVCPDFPKPSSIVGFAAHDRAEAAPGLPEALERFLSSGAAPLIFTLGSLVVRDPRDFYAESLAAARRLGMRSVLLGASNGAVEASGDTIACGYVSHSEAFPRAAAVIHQAGIGTLGAALRAGRPQLAVPAVFDQIDNARRLERLGVAKVIARRRYGARTASAALEALLNEPQFTRRAQELMAVTAREDGAEAASRIIDGLVGSAPGTSAFSPRAAPEAHGGRPRTPPPRPGPR